MGRRSQRILVEHDGADSPLELRIDIAGPNLKVPEIRKGQFQNVTFEQLSDANETFTYTIETVEADIHKPWITGLKGEKEELAVEIKVLRETFLPRDNAVAREYEIRVGWNQLPRDYEFRSAILAHVGDGESASEIEVGIVRANLFRNVAPTSVLLGLGRQQQIVLLSDRGATRHWSILAEEIPEWLSAQWNENDDHSALVISLADPSCRDKATVVRLQSSAGKKVEIPVRVVDKPSK